jgi:hypothetical protein
MPLVEPEKEAGQLLKAHFDYDHYIGTTKEKGLRELGKKLLPNKSSV